MGKLWKTLARDTLKEYRAKKVSLQSIQDRIAQLESKATAIRSTVTDSQRVRGGGNSQEERMLDNLALRGEQVLALAENRRDVLMVERALSILSDEQRLILDRSYIHPEKGAMERLCSELGYEKTTLYEKRDEALKQFTLALYGRSGG